MESWICCSATVNCGRRRAVPNEERRLRREGFLNYEQVSIVHVLCELVYLVLEHGIKRLNDARGMPPFGWLDSIGDSSHLPASLSLHFAYRAEATCREGFFELAIIAALDTGEKIPKEDIRGNAVVWVIVRLESGKQPQPILVSLLLDGDNARRWRGAAQVIDVPVG